MDSNHQYPVKPPVKVRKLKYERSIRSIGASSSNCRQDAVRSWPQNYPDGGVDAGVVLPEQAESVQ